MTLAVIAVTFVVLMAIGVPIAFAIAMTAFSGLLAAGMPNLVVLPQRMFTGLDSFPIMAIPFFIAAGYVMNECDLTDKIVEFSKSLVGHITGGLAHVNIAASMFFAGISGSAVADTAAIGGMLIPAMVKQGYTRDFSAAVTAVSSVMAPIIPPSIPAVILAVMTGVSVGAVFAAGVLPGILIGLFQMAVAYVISKRDGYRPNNRWEGWGNVFRQFIAAAPALVMPLIILGGVLGGVFTATEAGAVATIYGVLFGLITRKLNAQKLWTVFVNSGITSAVILVVIGAANVLNWVIATQQVPAIVRTFLDSVVSSPWVGLLLLNIVFFIAGMLLEGIAAMTLLVPILLPAAVAWGIDPLLFTVLVLINLNIGLVTPPVALCLYLAADIAERPAEKVFAAALPFLAVMILVLLIVTYVPDFTLFLPRLLGLA